LQCMCRNLHVQHRQADAFALQLCPQCTVGLSHVFVPR
jgi:hypothetical protein